MNKGSLTLLAFSHFISDINQGAVPALLPFLIITHNLSYTAAAALVFAANIVSSVIQPLLGYFADKFSSTWIMPIGLVLAGGGLALVGLTDNYQMILLAVGLSGIGIAAYHPDAARLVNQNSGTRKTVGVSIFATCGNVGFAIGPLLTTFILSLWGLKGTLWLLVPVTVTALVLAIKFSSSNIPKNNIPDTKTSDSTTVFNAQDDWSAFFRLTLAVSCRSATFWSLNTFLPLYWINVLGQSQSAGSATLTILLLVGGIGTLIAGQLADRYGNRTIAATGMALLIPLLALFVHIDGVLLKTALLVPIGLMLFAPFSPMVVLGQTYLPNHMGLASGVTLGLAVSIGGLVAPILGTMADNYGIQNALSWIAILPILATVIIYTLPEPQHAGLQTVPALGIKES